MESERRFTGFAGDVRVGSGGIREVLLRIKECFDRGEMKPLLIFEDQTGQQIDFDLSGTAEEVLERLSWHPVVGHASQGKTGPGRPKLGVVSREVSLLPRHWEWLEQQPAGISGTLRKLVEEARKSQPSISREAVGKFMWAVAGNLPNFEEASRAFYARDKGRFEALIKDWPKDIQLHLAYLLRESGCF